MSFGNFSYLVYMLVFTLIPIGILWINYFHILKKNVKIVLITAGIIVIYQILTDPFAEIWKAWLFSNDKILGLWLINFPIENTLFSALVSIAVSSATLIFIHKLSEKELIE